MFTEKKEAQEKIYEIGFNIMPTVGEKERVESIARIKEIVISNGGEEISEGEIEYIDLAYPMGKIIDYKRVEFDTAFFGWYKFSIATDKVALIKESLDAEKTILRFLLVNTVREDTISRKRIAVARKMKKDDDIEIISDEEGFDNELPHEKIEKLEKMAEEMVIPEAKAEVATETIEELPLSE